MHSYKIPEHCLQVLGTIRKLELALELEGMELAISLGRGEIVSSAELPDSRLEDICSMLSSIALYF